MLEALDLDKAQSQVTEKVHNRFEHLCSKGLLVNSKSYQNTIARSTDIYASFSRLGKLDSLDTYENNRSKSTSFH